MDRPEDFRYAGGYGLVDRSYDTWHVDIRTVEGGLIGRAVVLGHRLPEASTKERPQWVEYRFVDHDHSQAVCVPVNSRMSGDRTKRQDFVYYDEVGNFRFTVNRAGEYEVRNTKSDLLQLRILEDGGVVELRTPSTDVVLREADTSVTIDAAESVTINCKNASVHAAENVEVQAGLNASVQAGVNASVAAGANVSVQAGGTASLSATGAVTLVGASINLNPPPP